jgi:hypothetical protein
MPKRWRRYHQFREETPLPLPVNPAAGEPETEREREVRQALADLRRLRQERQEAG